LKSVIFILVVLFFVITPVSGQSLSDATGLIDRLDVQTSGYAFEIKLTSNFDLTDYTFDKNEKQITLYFDSALENNLAEIIIPKDLLSGNFMFYLNDQETLPLDSESIFDDYFVWIVLGSALIVIVPCIVIIVRKIKK
jgi:hypothetical protein